VDAAGRNLGEGKDLEALQRRLTGELRAALAVTGDHLQREGLRTWDLGALPRTVETRRQGRPLRAYPALVDEAGTVAVRMLESEAEQRRAMWRGTRRLLLLNVPSPVKSVLDRLPAATKLTLSRYPHGTPRELFDDCVACAVDALVAGRGGPAWDEAGFAALLAVVRAELDATTLAVVTEVARVLEVAGQLDQRLRELTDPALAPSVADVAGQLAELVYPGFVAATGRRRLPDLPRYLRAALRRLERLPRDPQVDRERMASVQRLQRALRELQDRPAAERPPPEALERLRWALEELRVSYFAQQLGTAHPVSEQRIRRALAQLG
jgi:ATP-dependent RNA helicase HrpA